MNEISKNTNINKNIYDNKKKAIRKIKIITIFFAPIILLFSGLFLINFFAIRIDSAILFLLLLMVHIYIFNLCVREQENYLIFGDNVNINALFKENDHVKTIKKKKSGVEGIVSGREKQMIDKDDDGYILVSEFYPLTESEVLDKIVSEDANFSKTEFYTFVKSVFILMQDAWSENNYHKLRSFEADRLYYRHKKEIEDLIEKNEYDIRERIFIKGVLLKDFRIESNKEIVIVALTANMRRYYKNEVVDNDYPYILAFSRNKGVKTKDNLKLSTTNCCNCGAVIDVSDDGICNYCNTSLVSGELEWVLVDMKQIDFTGK